jgi:hypothetical protein
MGQDALLVKPLSLPRAANKAIRHVSLISCQHYIPICAARVDETGSDGDPAWI